MSVTSTATSLAVLRERSGCRGRRPDDVPERLARDAARRAGGEAEELADRDRAQRLPPALPAGAAPPQESPFFEDAARRPCPRARSATRPRTSSGRSASSPSTSAPRSSCASSRAGATPRSPRSWARARGRRDRALPCATGSARAARGRSPAPRPSSPLEAGRRRARPRRARPVARATARVPRVRDARAQAARVARRHEGAARRDPAAASLWGGSGLTFGLGAKTAAGDLRRRRRRHRRLRGGQAGARARGRVCRSTRTWFGAPHQRWSVQARPRRRTS